MSDLIYKEESYKIIGACFEVYNEKGCGLLEPVYQECLEIEFGIQKLPFIPQKPLPLTYKGHLLKSTYQPDFICFEKVVLEIKAVSALADEHRAQVLNYLSATDYKLGLLVNFGQYPDFIWERIANTAAKRHHPQSKSLIDPRRFA